MIKNFKKAISLVLSLVIIVCGFSFIGTVSAANGTVTPATDWLGTAELAVALRANRLTASLDFDETTNGYKVNYTGTSSPKNFMFVTGAYGDSGKGYYVSVDYKTSTTGSGEAVGFVIGAKNNFGIISGNDSICNGLIGTDIYKTVFEPYRVSGSNSKYIRISSNDATTGKAYDYSGSTTNSATWLNDLTVNDGWNTISIFVSEKTIKQYVNGTLVCTISNIAVNSGYIGLYSGLQNVTFKNFTYTEVGGDPLSDFALAYALRATSANTSLSYDVSDSVYKLTSSVSNSKNFFYLSDKYNMTEGTGYTVSVDYRGETAGKAVGIIIGASSTELTGMSTAYRGWVYRDDTNGDYIRAMSCDGNNPAETSGLSYSKKVIFSDKDLYKTDDWNNLKVKVTNNSVTYYLNNVAVHTTTDVKAVGGYVGVSSEVFDVEFKNFTVTKLDPMETAEFANGLRATADNTTFDYNEAVGGYKIVSTATNPKHIMYITNEYLSNQDGYTVSVDYKTATNSKDESVGFVLGASSASKDGLTGANIYKTVFEPYKLNNSVATPYIRISSNDATSGNPYDYSDSTTNSATWLNDLTVNDGWNTISVYVSKNTIEQYVNGTLVRTVSNITVNSGYIGLYSGISGTAFRNLTVIKGKESVKTDKTVIACVGDGITYGVEATAQNNTYPFELQKRLGDSYEILNFGESDSTAVKGCANSYMYTQSYADSLSCNPDIVIIMLGTNDADKYWNTLGTAFYEKDLKEMLEAYKALPSNPTVYLCTTPYTLDMDLNSIILSEVLPVQQSLASSCGCELISMYALFEGKNALFADDLHLTNNGYAVVADKIYNALTKSVYGDVNGDKVIDLLDLVRIKKFFAEIQVDFIRANSDIDFDGTVSASDMVKLSKYLLGTIDSLGGNKVELTSEQLANKMASIAFVNNSDIPKITSSSALVTPYDDDWDYSHHPFITYFKGKLYAMWSSGHDAEDNVGQKIMLATSDDGLSWSEPVALVDTVMGQNSEMVSYALGFYTNGDTLVAYYHSFEYDISCLRENGTLRPEGNGAHINGGTYLKYTSDGSNWSESVSTNSTRSFTSAPVKTSDGKLIMMGSTNYIYTYDLSGISGWTEGNMSKNVRNELIANETVKTFTEGYVYELKDGTLRVVYRTNTDYLWCAESTNGGLSWTAPYKTNLTDDHSKAIFGVLPDGRYFYVGNPIINNGERLPLVLSVSEDGNSFDTHYILCNETYTIQSEGLYKSGHCAYPYVCFDDEYMYIIYSKGKEVIEVTKVLLEDI